MSLILNCNKDFKCVKCGKCCRAFWQITSNGKLTNKSFAERTSTNQKVIIKEYSDVCKYLASNLCQIHCEYGKEELPEICWLFPKKVVKLWNSQYISMSYACPTAFQNIINYPEPIQVCEIPELRYNSIIADTEVGKLKAQRDEILENVLENEFKVFHLFLSSSKISNPKAFLLFIIKLLTDFINTDSKNKKLSVRGKYLKQVFREMIRYFFSGNIIDGNKLDLDKITLVNDKIGINEGLKKIFFDYIFGLELIIRCGSIQLTICILAIYLAFVHLYIHTKENPDSDDFAFIVSVIETQFIHSNGFIEGFKKYFLSDKEELLCHCEFAIKTLAF